MGGSSCRYCGRTDCGCSYEITVCLLDENHEVIQDFKPELVNLDPDCDDCSWKQVHREGNARVQGNAWQTEWLYIKQIKVTQTMLHSSKSWARFNFFTGWHYIILPNLVLPRCTSLLTPFKWMRGLCFFTCFTLEVAIIQCVQFETFMDYEMANKMHLRQESWRQGYGTSAWCQQVNK